MENSLYYIRYTYLALKMGCNGCGCCYWAFLLCIAGLFLKKINPSNTKKQTLCPHIDYSHKF